MFGTSNEYIVFTAVAPVPVPLLPVVMENSTLEDYYRGQAKGVLDPLRPFAEKNHWNVRCTRAAHEALLSSTTSMLQRSAE